jgi:hypothetical protein
VALPGSNRWVTTTRAKLSAAISKPKVPPKYREVPKSLRSNETVTVTTRDGRLVQVSMGEDHRIRVVGLDVKASSVMYARGLLHLTKMIRRSKDSPDE